jgi:hypothetical protein
MAGEACPNLGARYLDAMGVHKLMGEESPGVNIIAEDGDEEENEDEEEGEYEDEGWWVGTVGVMEMPDWAGETPHDTPSPGQECEDHHSEAEISSQPEDRPEYPLSDYPTGEMAEDEWWDLEPTHSSPGRGGARAQRLKAPQRPLGDAGWPPDSAEGKRRKLRKRPGTTGGQDWEEARRSAWLRQILSDTSSDEDEDEERYGRFAESGRWIAELYKIPQHPVPTSAGECSG